MHVKNDPTALSTGAIAGRVEGQVEFSNIEVNNANVKNWEWLYRWFCWICRWFNSIRWIIECFRGFG